MKWFKYTINTTEAAEDYICSMLTSIGIIGVEIEDLMPVSAEESGGLFGDVVPDLPEDDGKARVSFYLAEESDQEETLEQVRNGLMSLRTWTDIGEGTITTDVTEDKDWINNWKKYFHQFRIDDIVITPSWEEDEVPEDAGMVLHIDPGTAFGTGKHESTQLAIRALRKYIEPGMDILDVGTGSGILGIIALKSGAGHVFGTDLDPNTIPAISENLENNSINDEVFDRVIGNLIDDPEIQDAAGYEKYDIALANIIAEILAPLTPEIPRHLKKGGLYITSGILHEREELVIDAARKAGMDVVEINRMGDWSCIVFSYNQDR